MGSIIIVILKPNFSPPLPIRIYAEEMGGGYNRAVLTPLQPELGHSVDASELNPSTRIERILQQPDFEEGDMTSNPSWIRARLRLMTESLTLEDVNRYTRQDLREHLLGLVSAFNSWFHYTDDSREFLENVSLQIRSPHMELEGRPDSVILEESIKDFHPQLAYSSFYPVSTGPLPHDEVPNERSYTHHDGYYESSYEVHVFS